MGTMSNGGTYYGPDGWQEYVDAFWNPSSWIHSDWTRDKQIAFNDLYNLSILGWSPFKDEFDKILNSDNNDLYMDRYDIDWSDVKDPRKLSNVSTTAIVGHALNFVSSNVKRLYR